MKGSLEEPTWGWFWRVLIIFAVLMTLGSLIFGCEKRDAFFNEKTKALECICEH